MDLIAKKVIKSAGVIAKIRHFTNLNALKLIYYALVYPYLIYGNIIWGNTYKKRIQKLMNIQKKIVPDWKVCKMRGGDRNLPVFLRGQMAKFARATRAWSTRAWSTRAWSIRLQDAVRCDFLLVPFCSNIIY